MSDGKMHFAAADPPSLMKVLGQWLEQSEGCRVTGKGVHMCKLAAQSAANGRWRLQASHLKGFAVVESDVAFTCDARVEVTGKSVLLPPSRQ